MPRRQALAQTDHRPWPKPSGPWVTRMGWSELAFLHWAVDPGKLAASLPPGLELDTFEGRAYLAVVPFFMRRMAPPLWPLARALPDFPELNLRTYVRVADKPGVWFYSLDAASWLGVRTARALLHLPYLDARFETSQDPVGTWHYAAERTHRNQPAARFRASYRPTGPARLAEPGSLEAFLTERYCLYTEHRGVLRRGEVHHGPWPLQPAEVQVHENTLAEPLGFALDRPPDHVLYAQDLEVRAWWPGRV